jgi:hypothetical protein
MNKKQIRQGNALNRLEAQLKSGFKPNRDRTTIMFNPTIPLTEIDVKRITREITTLKSKL